MASWVETFKQPVRDIKQRFTKSDLMLYAWDSRWKSYEMWKQYHSNDAKITDAPEKKERTPTESKAAVKAYQNGVVETEHGYRLPNKANNGVEIPKSYFNEEGEIDMRRLNGNQATRYMRALGIPIISR